MTEKQIDRIKLKIKKYRGLLTAEKRKFGGFFDNNGSRYYISDLYIQISDYKGVITYKRWFDKNFPDDIGNAGLSLNWSISYYELNKMLGAKIFTIDTAFQNIYLHGLLLNKKVERIEMEDLGYDMLEYTRSYIKDYKKTVTKAYLDWLSSFMETEEYKTLINEFITLNKQLKNVSGFNNRKKILNKIRKLEEENKSKPK